MACMRCSKSHPHGELDIRAEGNVGGYAHDLLAAFMEAVNLRLQGG